MLRESKDRRIVSAKNPNRQKDTATVDDSKGLQGAAPSSRVMNSVIIDLLCYVDKDRIAYGDSPIQPGMSPDEVDVDKLCEVVEALTEKINSVLRIDQEESGDSQESGGSQKILLTVNGGPYSVRSVKDRILSIIGSSWTGAEVSAGLSSIGLCLGRGGLLEFNESTFKEAFQGQKETSVNTVRVLNDSLYERLHWYVNPNAALFADLAGDIRRPRDGDRGYIAGLDVQQTKKKEELEKKLQTVNMLISTSTGLIDRLVTQAPVQEDEE